MTALDSHRPAGVASHHATHLQLNYGTTSLAPSLQAAGNALRRRPLSPTTDSAPLLYMHLCTCGRLASISMTLSLPTCACALRSTEWGFDQYRSCVQLEISRRLSSSSSFPTFHLLQSCFAAAHIYICHILPPSRLNTDHHHGAEMNATYLLFAGLRWLQKPGAEVGKGSATGSD